MLQRRIAGQTRTDPPTGKKAVSPPRLAKKAGRLRDRSLSVNATLVPNSLRKTSGIRSERPWSSDPGKERLVEIDHLRTDSAGFTFDVCEPLDCVDGAGPAIAHCVVTSVEPGGWVDKLHVQAGDEIVSINGVDLVATSDLHELRKIVNEARNQNDGMPKLIIRTRRASASPSDSASEGSASLKTARSSSVPSCADSAAVWDDERTSVKSSGNRLSVDRARAATTPRGLRPFGGLATARSEPDFSQRRHSSHEQYVRPTSNGRRLRGSDDSATDSQNSSSDDQLRQKWAEGARQSKPRRSLLLLRQTVSVSSPPEEFMPNLASALAEELNLPFLVEPAAKLVFEDEDNLSPETVSKAKRKARSLLRSSTSSTSSLSSEVFAEVRAAEEGNDTNPSNDSKTFSGLLVACVLDGQGLAEPGSEVYCVLDVGPRTESSTGDAVVQADRSVCWDDDVDIYMNNARQLTVTCFARSQDGEDDVRCTQASLLLAPLFIGGPQRRVAVAFSPESSVRLKLLHLDKSSMLRRQPSLAQCGSFGIALELVVQRERCRVPILITKCIGEIEKRGLGTTGLYRRCSASKKKAELRRAFEVNSHSVNISEENVPDANVLADLLKEYLRMLPEPLFTQRLYQDLLKAVHFDDDDEITVDTDQLLSLLPGLPKANMDTVKVLFRHFQCVLENSAANRMTAESLSICFGPVLMCPSPVRLEKDKYKRRASTVKSVKEFKAPGVIISSLLELGWPDSSAPKNNQKASNPENCP